MNVFVSLVRVIFPLPVNLRTQSTPECTISIPMCLDIQTRVDFIQACFDFKTSELTYFRSFHITQREPCIYHICHRLLSSTPSSDRKPNDRQWRILKFDSIYIYIFFKISFCIRMLKNMAHGK